MKGLMTVSAELEKEKTEVFEWVKKELPKIRGFIRKYKNYSPYEEEEFISQAYLTAVEAEARARSNCKGYDYYFWSLFKQACREMTYTKGYRIPCYHEEYVEFGDDDKAPTKLPKKYWNNDNIFEDMDDGSCSGNGNGHIEVEKLREKKIKKALSLMTPLERKVWRYLLKGQRVCDIAKKMGYKRQYIQKLRNKGMERVKEYFEK